MAGQQQMPGTLQGIPAPNVVVNPSLFYAATKRERFLQKGRTAFSGLGAVEPIELRQAGIVSALEVRVSGTITVGTADVTSFSREWPFNLVKRFKLSANGQSNLIDARGLTIRAHEFITNAKLSDQGRSKYVGATAVTDGTLALASDDWGTGTTYVLGPGHTPGGTDAYSFDITYLIPIAADPVSLIGSLFAQTTSTNLALEIEWNTEVNLLTKGSAVMTYALFYEVSAVAYSIPTVGGNAIVPDVTTFHQLSEFRQGGLTAGENEIKLPGTGTGRKLMRVIGNIYSSSAPLAVNSTNYASFGWKYGGNVIPESWNNGATLRALNERQSGVLLGGTMWGLWLLDFASEHALRDLVDEGMTADLRVVPNLVSSPTSGYVQCAQETLFLAPVGA